MRGGSSADAVDAVRQPRVGEAGRDDHSCGVGQSLADAVRHLVGAAPDHDRAVVLDPLDEEPDDVLHLHRDGLESGRRLGMRPGRLLPQRRSDPPQDVVAGGHVGSRLVAAAVGLGPPRPERLARRRRQVAGAGPRRGTRPRYAADRRPPAGQGPAADHRDEPVRDRAGLHRIPEPWPSAKSRAAPFIARSWPSGRPSRWASTTLARRWTRTDGMSIWTGHTS